MEHSRLFDGLARAALDLVLPPSCPACVEGRLGAEGLCDACSSRLGPLAPRACARCAGPQGPGARRCVRTDCPVPWVGTTVATGPYAGLLGELIRRVKYGGDEVLLPALTRRLRFRLRHEQSSDAPVWGEPPELVLPVPDSHRVHARRVHLAHHLALAAAVELGVPSRRTLLRRIGRPLPQASLSRTRRRDAPRGTVGRRLPWLAPWRLGELDDAVVLLVDDVLTTGATARECAKVLRREGARAVHVAVLARA